MQTTTAPRRTSARGFVAGLGIAVLPTIVFFAALEAAARLYYTPESQLPPTLFRYDPETWYALTPSFTGSYADHAVRTNAYGYRSPEVPIAKPAATVRIVVVGDSVSFGHGVDQEQAYPALLEAELRARLERPVEVINTSVPGNSPYQEYVDLVRALRFAPDAVVYQFTLNDVVEPFWGRPDLGGGGIDYHGIANVPYLDHVLSQHSALYLLLKDVAARLRLGNDSRAQRAKVALAEERYKVEALVEQPVPEDIQRAWQLALRDIARMQERCAEAGIPFVILASPVDFQITESHEQALPQRTLEAFAAEHGVAFVDVLAALQDHVAAARRGDDAARAPGATPAASATDVWQEYFIDYDHPSPEGHRLIAGLLAGALVRTLERSHER